MEHPSEIRVSFDSRQAAFLASCVESGRYQSASEVVREGLRLLERSQAEVDRVREMIRVGAEQLDRGETVDGETVFRELAERIDAHEAGQRRRSEAE